jgi:hypothetical protein
MINFQKITVLEKPDEKQYICRWSWLIMLEIKKKLVHMVKDKGFVQL